MTFLTIIGGFFSGILLGFIVTFLLIKWILDNNGPNF